MSGIGTQCSEVPRLHAYLLNVTYIHMYVALWMDMNHQSVITASLKILIETVGIC